MSRSRIQWLATALTVVALVVAGCGDDGPSRDESGRVTRAQRIRVVDLLVGDCFNDPEADQLDEIQAVEVVPCAEPHDNEVFHSFPLAAGDRPSDDEVFQLAASQCFPAFDAYVGIEFEISELDVFPLTPTAEEWDRGHRTVHCVLFNLDLSELVGSAKGTAR